MASTASDSGNLGTLHDASQCLVEIARLEEIATTLLQRWKEEQAARIKAEETIAILSRDLLAARNMLQHIRAVL